MLHMMSVIVDYTFKNVFLTFYIRQANIARPVITYPLLSLSTGLGALIYTLINALKKLMP